MSILINQYDENSGYFPNNPFKTKLGSEFFTTSNTLKKDAPNYLFGFCWFKDEISNIHKGSKVKVKSFLDDFVFVFVKYENIMTKYGFCINFNQEKDDFEFLVICPQGSNSRARND